MFNLHSIYGALYMRLNCLGLVNSLNSLYKNILSTWWWKYHIIQNAEDVENICRFQIRTPQAHHLSRQALFKYQLQIFQAYKS